MATQPLTLPEKSKPTPAPKKYDVTNPTNGRRVIYSGIQSVHGMKAHTFEPGEKKAGIELSDLIVRELRDRNINHPHSDLLVVDAE